ncbi:MAG: di-heme enzyme [Polyangiaceae bacterium]|nr:di-heme enzyme [Polyangiaceae bacterium]
MSAAKIELGRHLFYDRRLSGNLTQSCASCHRQELAFTDGVARPKGSTGEEHPRSAMSLANVAYAPSLTWANPNLATLEKQTLVPMFGERPVELGLAGREGEMLERLRAEPLYPSLFEQAFPGDAEPIRLDAVVKAISAFERSLISGDAPYDRFTQKGDLTAVSTSALRGRELFFSEKLECFHCHGNFLFADAAKHTGTKIIEMLFHNTGLYNVDGAGAYPPGGEGLFEITSAPADMGRFKAPSLRNVAVTAPYMHDGSIASLDEAIDHYAAAGRTLAAGAYPGVGSLNPFKSEFIVGFTLDPTERADLKAFLESLTDQGFLTNPAFADPWPPAPPLASPALGATFGP